MNDHRRRFAGVSPTLDSPGSFVVAVSGDFERGAMIAQLEELFGEPFPGKPPAVPRIS